MRPSDDLIVSSVEPTGKDRKKVWMQKGKNLFNSKLLQQGALNGITGLIQINSDVFNKRICVTNHISLKKGIYTLSYSGLTQCVVYRFNSTKTLYTSDQDQSWHTGNKTFELTEDGYVTFAFKNTDGTEITVNDISNVQLEQGSTTTSYEAYIEPKIYVKNGNDVYEEFISKEDILEKYSTTEQKVGTWIDGKPLYKKIIKTTAPTTTANGTYVSSMTNISDNIDNAFIEFAYVTDSYETNSPIPYTTNAGYQIKANVGMNNNNRTLNIYNGVTTYNGCTVTASVLYTKTTD